MQACHDIVFVFLHQDYPSCTHMQLFELGSLHYPYYLINVNFEPFALEKIVPEHTGLGPVTEINMLVRSHDVIILYSY